MRKCLHMRTSLTLPEPLLFRLRRVLAEEHMTLREFVVEQIERAVAERETTHNAKVYEALDRLAGSGPNGLTDVASTMNETLYGENGAWRGQRDE